MDFEQCGNLGNSNVTLAVRDANLYRLLRKFLGIFMRGGCRIVILYIALLALRKG